MPLTVEQFTKRLADSGILPDEQLRDFIAALPEQSAARTDAEELARELVRQRKLSKFQAEQIYAGRGESLTLGNYVILDKLGQGGMGMVLKAEHKRMKRLVAIKVMSPSAVKTPDALKRFHREVEAAAKLRHPNIVAADDADEAKGTHFLVMEYVEGSDLSAHVKKNGPFSVEQAVNCIIQAARGLEYAHKRGVVHRDIKPANLLLDREGTVKILDMGLARIEGEIGAQAELTSTGAVMGTVDYMAPEQARNTKTADARSDIYSLGISLWYLLTGRPAFDGLTLTERLLAHQTDPIPSLVDAVQSSPVAPRQESRTSVDVGSSAASSGVDGASAFVSRSDTATLTALDAVFRRMVAKKPQDRPQSMTEVIAELERCRAGWTATSDQPVSRTAVAVSTAFPATALPVGSPPATATSAAEPVLARTLAFGSAQTPSGPAESPTLIRESDPGAPGSAMPVADEANTFSQFAVFERTGLFSTSAGGPGRSQTKGISNKTRLVLALVAVLVVGVGVIPFLKQDDRKLAAPGRPAVPNEGKSAEGGQPANGAETDPQRRLAGAVLAAGGHVQIHSAEGQSPSITKRDDLPSQPFVVTAINVAGRVEWSDARQALLEGVHYLLSLGLSGTSITDAGLSPMIDMSVMGVDVSFTPVTNVGAARLATNRGVQYLLLPHTTTITPEVCQTLAASPRLRHLALTTDDAGVRALSQSQSLRHLSLTGKNDITPQSLAELRRIPHLRSLWIGGGDFTDELLTGVEQIATLRMVWLGNGVTAEAAQRLQSARPDLVVFHPAVRATDGERAAVQWMLDAGAQLVGTTQPGESFETVPEKSFELGNVDFPADHSVKDAAPLRGLRSLQTIRCQSVTDADALAEQIATIPSIHDVAIDGRTLTAEGLAKLASLPELEQLNFGGLVPVLPDEAWQVLTRCRWLWNLGLGNSTIGDGGLVHLGQCPQLQDLSLGQCRNITAAGLRHLRSLRWLWSLELSMTNLDDSAVDALSELTNLRLLRLNGTQFTADGITRLSRALPRCTITWNGGLVLPTNRKTAENGHPTNPADPDRAAAEWALSFGGESDSVEIIKADGEWLRLRPGQPLPAERFVVNDLVVNSEKIDNAQVKQRLSQLVNVGRVMLTTCPRLTDDVSDTLARLPALKMLSVEYSGMKSPGILKIAKARTLTNLNVSSDQFSSELADFLQASSVVNFGLLSGTDDQFRMVFRAKQLKSLYFAGAAVARHATWARLPEQLPALIELGLTSSNVSDADLHAIAHLSELETLSLHNTQVTDIGLVALSRSTRLKSVTVSQTKVTPHGIADFLEAKPGCEVVWDGADHRAVAEWVWSVGGKVQVAGRGAEWLDKVALTAPREESRTSGDADRENDTAPPTTSTTRSADFTRSVKATLSGPVLLTGVDLSGLQTLKDEDLARLADCTTLRDLQLHNTSLTGACLTHLQRLMSLNRLNVAYLPVEDKHLTSLREMKQLQYLRLGVTKVTDAGMPALAGLTELVGITLQDAPISSVGLESLKRLPKLASLDLNNTAAESRAVEVLCEFPRLYDVNLSNTRVTEADVKRLVHRPLPWHRLYLSNLPTVTDAILTELRGQRELITLELGGTSVTAAAFENFVRQHPRLGMTLPTDESTAPDLRVARRVLAAGGSLSVQIAAPQPTAPLSARTDFNSARAVHRIEDLPKAPFRIVYLQLAPDGAKVPDETLAEVGRLEMLRNFSTAGANFADRMLLEIAAAPQLEWLYLTGSKLSRDTVRQLATQTGLTGLHLHNTSLEGPAAASLAALTKLKSLDIGTSTLTDDNIAFVEKLTELELLAIGNTQIVNHGWASIAKLPKLKHIEAYNMPVTDEALRHAGQIESLELLAVGGGASEVGDVGLQHLRRLRHLRELHINHCRRITDAGLESLAELPAMERLHLNNTPITDAGLKHLAKIKTLKFLDLQDCTLSESAIDDLQDTLPWCRILRPKTPLPGAVPAVAPFDAAQARTYQEAWAKHLGAEVESTNSVGQKMVLIPPGEFLMGSSDEDVAAALKAADAMRADRGVVGRIETSERPQHRVVISKPLRMSATEVTVGQFKRFVEASKYVTEAERYGFGDSTGMAPNNKVTETQRQSNWRSPGYAVDDNSPVAQITWNDAVAYCKWLSDQEKITYRLPTEAEWEYACRAGSTTQYSFGDDYKELQRYGWPIEGTVIESHAVGKLLPNNFGLFDMHGNLYEWCSDFINVNWYGSSPANDPVGPASGSNRVLRGGSIHNGPSQCRSASRYSNSPSGRFKDYGFRCVAELQLPTVAAPTTLKFASDEWIDVMPLLNPDLDKVDIGRSLVGKNDWRIEQGELRYYGDEKSGKLYFPVRCLGRSMEWEFEFTRTAGDISFNTDIPIPGGFVPLTIGNDKIGFVNESLTDKFQIVNKERTKLRLRVTQAGADDRLEVFVNDKPLVDWTGPLAKHKIEPPRTDLRNQSEHISLFAHGPTNYSFRAIRIRMLNGGTAQSLRPTREPN